MKRSKDSRRQPDKGLYDVPEAASYLNISERSVRRHYGTGDLEHCKVGWLIRFRKEALDEFARRYGGDHRRRR